MRIYYLWNELYVKRFLDLTCYAARTKMTSALPRKRNVMIDPSLVWNVSYNAQSHGHHPATSPNAAPATQKEWLYCFRITYETSFTMRKATKPLAWHLGVSNVFGCFKLAWPLAQIPPTHPLKSWGGRTDHEWNANLFYVDCYIVGFTISSLMLPHWQLF